VAYVVLLGLGMRLLCVGLLAAALGCRARAAPEHRQGIAAAPTASAGSGLPENRRGPVRMGVLDPQATPPTFVMYGGPRGPGRLVFLHGMCG